MYTSTLIRHFFAGRGLGFFVTGKLFDPVTGLGGRWTFRFYSLLALTVLIVYASTNMIASKYSRSKNKGHVSNQEKEQPAGEFNILYIHMLNTYFHARDTIWPKKLE